MSLKHILSGIVLVATAVAAAQAQTTTPDALIKQVSTEVIDSVKSDKAIQAGDLNKIIALVDAKVMPHVNFQRMTAAAVGRHWREATPEQKTKLQAEFKTLLVRTYAGALTQVREQTVALKPFRAGAGDSEVVVRTEIKGKGEPIQLDYRLEKAGDGWKIYDLNVGGFWIVEAYKGQFAKDLNAGGLDALITRLAEKNKATNGNVKN